jgi:hydrogenase nickel incorporation protein HypB
LPIDPVITTPTPVSETRHLNREDLIAAQNRGWFKGRNVLALNLVGLPGSGKTALIARTFADLRTEVPFAVVQMDYVIGSDADHLQAMGCRVIQTERGKHLDASMVEQGLEKLNPPLNSVVIIENANYAAGIPLPDLGERAKVVVLSVTEGDDKPLKYPQMFRDSQVMLLTKVDLLPYVSFSVQQCWNHARQVNPQIQLLQVSSVTGEGMDVWYTWLRRSRPTS